MYLALEAERDRLRDQIRDLVRRIREEEELIREKQERIRRIMAREAEILQRITSPDQRAQVMLRIQSAMRPIYDELNRENALIQSYRQLLAALLERMRVVGEQMSKYRRLILYGEGGRT
jgi:chromosome segregation ATPase